MGWFDEAFSGTKTEPKNEHGQPINARYRGQAVQGRQMDELIGLVKGVLADGVVCQQEVDYLLRWLKANRAVANEWPARVIYPRIADALADGHLDAAEEADIMALLMQAVGGSQVPNHSFCFTGRFASGPRSWCESVVTERGGIAISSITKKLNYLVIGEIGSRDWLHSTFGTKIQKAVEYREAGVPLHIISEQHWHERIGV